MTNALAELSALATELVVAGGELATKLRTRGVDVVGSKTSDEDIVTFADREVEAFIRGRIAEVRPNDSFFGEEGSRGSGSTGLTWVVDPIDGTVNYLYGIGFYGVSVAVVEGDADPLTWTPLAGAVNNPILQEIFTATKGGGAWLNNRQIFANANVPLNLTLVATGFAYDADVRRQQAQTLVRLVSEIRDIRRLGASSVDLCSVAAGRVDAYFEQRLSPWDHAAAELIASEAGALVQGFDGARASADMLIAAHPSIFGPLHDLIRG